MNLELNAPGTKVPRALAALQETILVTAIHTHPAWTLLNYLEIPEAFSLG
jgi:hypothetical protein